MLVTLIGISIIIFVLLRVVPGNIVDILFDAAGFVDPADKANLEKELGLSDPIVVQYLHWISGLLRGDLGYSYVSEKPALQEILPRIPITAKLAALALLFSASIGIPLGVISAVHQGSRLDYTLRVVSLSGLSLPSFWLGLLILMASVSLFGTMPIYTPNPKTWAEAIAIYCVPAMAVGFRSAALTMRITRSSMLEILRQDYIRTARAKGASEASVNYRHALKNAVLPVITVLFVWVALSADLICRYSPLSVDSAHRLASPDWRHWLGTDSFGRDVWARIVHGARISLAVGIGSTTLGASIGVMVGLASGYLSGWVDLLFQRITDILQALPLLVRALVMTAALGPSLPTVVIASAIPLIPMRA